MEQWKDIEGTDGQYSVSSNGRVRSNERTVIRTTGKPYFVKERILKQGYDDGYHKVFILCNGKYKTLKVHRLVANAFIINYDNKPQVNHINGIRNDNNYTNLEWVTNQENQLHAYKFLTRKLVNGENNGSSKLKLNEVLEIRKIAKERGRYYGRKELANKYNVSEGTIKEIVTNRIWKM